MLPAAVKERVFEVLDRIQPKSRYKVLVLDDKVKQLFDLAVDKAELLNRQVANVLSLEQRRPNEPQMECVYIVEHTKYAFACIEADFVHSALKYAGIHVFLLRRLKSGDASVQRFAAGIINRYLRSIDYLPFGFLPLENRIFTLGLPHANAILYNESCKDLAYELVDHTGREIANVCESLNMIPYIRYSNRWKKSRMNDYPALVAKSAAQHIEAMSGKFPIEDLEGDARPMLLVLDRSTDITAPIRHEFALQAMALDVLNEQFSPANTMRKFTSSDPKRNRENSLTELKEDDPNWTELRHKHIAIVTEELTERIHKLRTDNPHLADMESDVSVGDVRNMLAALPEFMKERERVGLSLDIAQECMAKVDKLKLKELAEFEQACILGTTTNGKRPELCLADSVVAIMADRSIGKDLKMRALAMYAVYREGLRNMDFARLQFHAKLSDEELKAIQALSYLGYPMFSHGPSSERPPQALTAEHEHQPVLFSRVKTGLQTTIEQLVSGALSSSEYPYVGDTPDSTQEARSTATSLRNPKQRATWAQKVSSKSASSSSEMSRAKRRIFLFMIGGFTASESQAIYDFSEKSMFSVVLGGHDLLTPQKFVDFLSKLNAPRPALMIPEDQPERLPENFTTMGKPMDGSDEIKVQGLLQRLEESRRINKIPNTREIPVPLSPKSQRAALEKEVDEAVDRHIALQEKRARERAAAEAAAAAANGSPPTPTGPQQKKKKETVRGKLKGAFNFSKEK